MHTGKDQRKLKEQTGAKLPRRLFTNVPNKTRENGTAKDRKISDALDGLNGRQRMYVNGIAAGKTKKQAAIAAGYSVSTANNAAAIIEQGAVKEAFQELIQQTIPVEKIIERLAEGLDAMETKCFVHEGGVIYSRSLVNFTERRRYLELAVKYGGYYVEKQQIELADQSDPLPEEQVIRKAKKLIAALEARRVSVTAG